MRSKRYLALQNLNRCFSLLLPLLLLTSGISLAQSLEITSFSPKNGSASISKSANITLKFNASVNSATLTNNSVIIHGSQSGIITASFSGVNGTSQAIDPTVDFKPGENITVLFKTTIQDISGNTLNIPLTILFKVGTLDIAPAELVSSNSIDAANSWAKEISAADIDDDGDMDFFSVSPIDDLIEWHENNGSQSFTQHSISSTLDNPYDIKAVDIDNDGDMDAVGAVLNEDKIVWFENDGSETFTTHTISSSADGAIEVTVIDMDADGDMDVVSVSSNDDKVAWYENNGSESFTERVISTSVNGANSVYAIDLDNDGDVDVLASAFSDDELLWFENDGNQNFTKRTISAFQNDPSRIRAADIDGDSDIDIASTSSTRQDVFWYGNDGSQSFTKHTVDGSAGTVQNVEIADYDGDGDADIIATGVKLHLYENDGSESFTKNAQNVPDFPSALTLADVDSDSKLDIIISNDTENTIRWHKFNEVPLKLVSTSPSRNELHTKKGSTIQLTYNHEIDASSVNSNTIKVRGSISGDKAGTLTGTGTKTLTFTPTSDFKPGERVDIHIASGLATSLGTTISTTDFFSFTAPSAPIASTNTYQQNGVEGNLSLVYGLHPADIDGDGDVDIISADGSTHDWIHFHENDGKGNFTDNIISTSVDGPRDVFAIDLDSDGDMDILSAATFDNTIYWHENDGSETFTRKVISTIASSVQDIFAMDMDNDGDIDVLSASSSDDKFAWYENNGSESFTEHLISTQDGATALHAADFDADGDIDVVGASIGNNRISYFENDGNQNFTFINLLGQSGASSVYPADVDGDGDLDFVFGADNFGWVENDYTSGTTFVNFHVLSTSANPKNTVHAADMDGDGDMDLITGSRLSSLLEYYENDGSENFTIRVVATGSPAAAIQDVFAADIDKDGDLDFLSAAQTGNRLDWFEAIRKTDQNSLQFGATQAYIDLSSVADDMQGQTSFTFETWIKPDYSSQTSSGAVTVLGVNSSSDGDVFFINIGEGSTTQDQRIRIVGSSTLLGPVLADNTWHHIAYSLTGGTGTLFVNGIQVGQHAHAANFSSTNKWSFGQEFDSGTASNLYKGLLDEIRIWKTSRSEEELRTNLYKRLFEQEDNLIAYLPLDEGSGSFLSDKSTNANNGQLITGTPSWSSDSRPFGTFITGNEGWRIMSSPGNLTYQELLGPLWTQGFTGADTESGTANVLTWSESARAFQAISNITDTPVSGTSFIVYVFDDADNDGSNDGFPKKLETNASQNEGEINRSLSFTNTGEPADKGWNLIGNPYGTTIDWDDNNGLGKSNLESSIYVWSDSAGGGAGAYLSWNGTTGTLPNGKISPWQGFWVKTNASSPSIRFKETSRSNGGVFYKAQPTKIENNSEIKFKLENNGYTSRSVIYFSDSASDQKDDFDTYKLQPLNREFLSLFSLSSDNIELDINAYPDTFDEVIEIPFGFKGSSLTSSATLSWTELELPENLNVHIIDLKNQKEIDLKTTTFYSFIIDSISTAKRTTRNLIVPSHGVINSNKTKKRAGEPRFILQISPNITVSNEPTTELPTSVELQQNYPNPFNPSTTIAFGIPETGKVSLEIFDILGRKVTTLLNGENKSAGRHTVNFDASSFSSGMYIYRLQIGSSVLTKKLTLIK